jgi:hypothetical protein
MYDRQTTDREIERERENKETRALVSCLAWQRRLCTSLLSLARSSQHPPSTASLLLPVRSAAQYGGRDRFQLRPSPPHELKDNAPPWNDGSPRRFLFESVGGLVVHFICVVSHSLPCASVTPHFHSTASALSALFAFLRPQHSGERVLRSCRHVCVVGTAGGLDASPLEGAASCCVEREGKR